jgi:hypothetical protein
MNIQAGRLHVEPAAGLLGRGHREDASDNRAPSPDLHGRWLLGEDQLRYADQVVMSPWQDLGAVSSAAGARTARRSCAPIGARVAYRIVVPPRSLIVKPSSACLSATSMSS